MNERDFDQLVASVKQAGAIKRGKLKPGRTIQASQAAGDMTMPLTRDFKPPKSLMRMFGPSGNPHASNLFEVISRIQQHEGVQLEVNAVR